MSTPTLAERVRHGLGLLLRRPHDPDREREYWIREAEVEHERSDAVDSPAPGMHGSLPIDYGIHKRH